MPAINEIVTLLLDNTISCSVSTEDILLRGFALMGLIHLAGTALSGLGKTIAYPVIYTWGAIKWIYNKFKGRTI